MEPECRTRRALSVLWAMDRTDARPCAHCEGILLAAAAGLPAPVVVVDEDGDVTSGEAYMDALLARLESRLARRVLA